MYFALYSALSILRHRTYHSFGFDLGLYDQVFWNTTQGRILESTMTHTIAYPHSQLGDHFSPIYFLVVPFYFLYPHPETLVLVQTFVIALGAWPTYLLARHLLPVGYALLWEVVYFLFVPLAYLNLFDFHETAFSIAPLGFALYFIKRGKKVWFLLALLLAFLTKEEIALIGVGFGVYVWWGERDWKLGVPVVLGSLAAFEVIVQLVIPYFAGGQSYSYIAERYATVGGSPLGIIRTAVTDPMRIVRAVAQVKKVYFVIAIFGPVLGLTALAGWAAILVVPTLSYTLLSDYEAQYTFSSQYSAPLIPLVIGTSIIALARIPERARIYVALGVVVSTVIFSWAYGDMPYSRKFNWSQFETEPRYASFLRSLDQISPDARVSAETGITSHLSERRYIYDFGFEGVQDAQWVVLDYEGTNYNIEAFNEQVTQVEARGYAEVASGYGLALLRKS